MRSSQYLNNLIGQDHRAIKRRCASMGGFKTFGSAAVTLAGIELAYRIRKRQFSFGRGRYQNCGSLKQLWERALAYYFTRGNVKRADLALNHSWPPIWSASNTPVPLEVTACRLRRSPEPTSPRRSNDAERQQRHKRNQYAANSKILHRHKTKFDH